MRSPIGGRLYKYHLQDKQQVAKGALVAEIIPKDSVVVVKLGVTAIDQPKIKAGQSVHFRMEAFPYQKFGTLSGAVLDVKPVSADGSFEVTASLNSSEKVNVENVPIGSGVMGLIVTGHSSLFSIAAERILGEWN
jgi:multidrug efflux pump subunit AcrA (membrane-fusion protein)